MKYSSLLKYILIYFSLFTATHNYENCPLVYIQSYTYTLSSMKSIDNIVAALDNAIIEISPCETIDCSGQDTYVTKKENSVCVPYTAMYAPIPERFQLIDQNSPEKGIKINYFPHREESNGTVSIFKAVLQIYCNEEKDLKTQCTQTKLNNENIIKCTTYLQAGCPEVSVNSFWQFLIDNKLIFAIIMWIVSLFQLLFGYLAIRLTIFIFGIYTGSCFGFIFVAENYTNFYLQSNSIFIFIICLSVLLGISFGISLLTLPRLGYFNIGLWVAMTISLLLQNSVYFLTGSLLAFYITFGILGLIMGIISLLQFKMYIMISSAIVSSFWIIRNLGFFLPNYPNEFFSSGNFLISKSTPWQFYLYLVSIIILSILGIVFQFCLSKRFQNRQRGKYYLQDDDPLRQKISKLLQFREVKDMLKAGKEEVVFLKNLVVEQEDEEVEKVENEQGLEIEMMRMDSKKKQQ